MDNLDEFEKVFIKRGWDKYLQNYYKWVINGKDPNILIKFIEKIEGSKLPKKPSRLELNNMSITYNPELDGYDIESSEDLDVGIKGCNNLFHDDKTVGCKRSN